MSKNIALIALLLPFSGYAITKEEKEDRIDEMHEEAREYIWKGLHNFMYILCKYNKCLDLSSLSQEDREWFLKQTDDLKSKIEKLDKEYQELEQA
jgi:hypothetical protein